ncbi:hypothetical protein [Rubritalea tangerina]
MACGARLIPFRCFKTSERCSLFYAFKDAAHWLAVVLENRFVLFIKLGGG